jgi:hypothetical protein
VSLLSELTVKDTRFSEWTDNPTRIENVRYIGIDIDDALGHVEAGRNLNVRAAGQRGGSALRPRNVSFFGRFRGLSGPLAAKAKST